MTKTKTKTPEQQLLTFAKRKAKDCRTWIELHNAVYGIGGKFVKLFASRSDRASFVGTAEYKAVAELLAGLPRDAGGKPKGGESSGKFVVRMPPSMHAALIVEADREGVSLNQLCVAKLATQLGALV